VVWFVNHPRYTCSRVMASMEYVICLFRWLWIVNKIIGLLQCARVVDLSVVVAFVHCDTYV